MTLDFDFAPGAQSEMDALQPDHGWFVGKVIAHVSNWCETGQAPFPGTPHGNGRMVPIHDTLPDSGAVVMVYGDASDVVVAAAGTWKTPAEFAALEARARSRV